MTNALKLQERIIRVESKENPSSLRWKQQTRTLPLCRVINTISRGFVVGGASC